MSDLTFANVQISTALDKRLRYMAASKSKSRSFVIREALEEYLTKAEMEKKMHTNNFDDFRHFVKYISTVLGLDPDQVAPLAWEDYQELIMTGEIDEGEILNHVKSRLESQDELSQTSPSGR